MGLSATVFSAAPASRLTPALADVVAREIVFASRSWKHIL